MRNFAIYALGVCSGSLAVWADTHSEPELIWIVVIMSVVAALIGKTK